MLGLIGFERNPGAKLLYERSGYERTGDGEKRRHPIVRIGRATRTDATLLMVRQLADV